MDLTADICRLVYLLLDNPKKENRGRAVKTSGKVWTRDSRRRPRLPGNERPGRRTMAAFDAKAKK